MVEYLKVFSHVGFFLAFGRHPRRFDGLQLNLVKEDYEDARLIEKERRIHCHRRNR